MRSASPAALLSLLLVAVSLLAVTAPPLDDPVLWPERQRSFFEDGPALLLSPEQRQRIAALGSEERAAAIAEFLGRDPIPETEPNELAEGIRRRQRLVEREFLSPQDVRAQLLFLNGAPDARVTVECGITFKPLEIWTYGQRRLVLYRPGPTLPFRLWLPIDSKRVLYTDEMEYLLLQFEELRGRIVGRRFDLQTCRDTVKVDDATGIEGIYGFRSDRPKMEDLLPYRQAPADLAEWARRAAATPLGEEARELPVDDLAIFFPESYGQRIVSRMLVTLPATAGVEPTETEPGHRELRLAVDVLLEQEGQVFDQFRVLFKLPPSAEPAPLALAVDRPLRPDRNFVVRLRVRDEVGGAEAFLARGFHVPDEPQAVADVPVPQQVIVALGEELAKTRIAGQDSLVLVPPDSDVVLTLWRAEALVTGERIRKVVFLVDGKQQLARGEPPYSVELRLSQFPTEQVVRAEGYDEKGELVAADEVVLNRPTGALRVRILEPRRGTVAAGDRTTARAEVVVPEDTRIESVEFLVNDAPVATLTSPPWQSDIEVPRDAEVSYLTVVAHLDDGSRAEDVRFLVAPRYLEEVNVNLVELYTTVTDRSGRLVKGLPVEDFQVKEQDRPRKISKFELVEDLPLTLAITIDTSGSMATALPEAQKAARGFLDNIITPKDRYFVVSFSDRPQLLMPPTDDVTAIEGQLEALRSVGWTTLHDAVVTTLYYFRGVRGRRAMVLLSDGDDTASAIPFRDALEYARRSGVAIYTIGLGVSHLDLGVRKKLNELAQETGGRSFYIDHATELTGIYDEIEDELRSQYLVAYAPDPPPREGEFRTVEVVVQKGKLKARTIRGYYP